MFWHVIDLLDMNTSPRLYVGRDLRRSCTAVSNVAAEEVCCSTKQRSHPTETVPHPRACLIEPTERPVCGNRGAEQSRETWVVAVGPDRQAG